MKICIIQAGTSNFSGSFIKAHQELIAADKVILHGPTHDFRINTVQNITIPSRFIKG
tara:strand:+ start:172 stop:342 length:171 start_codon:yes stop_codon:yes gene_type:complete